MSFISRAFNKGSKLALAHLMKQRNIVFPVCFNFSQLQSKNFVMKKTELSNDLLISLSMGFEHKEATNQKELTQNLIINNVLKDKVVQDVFNELDRDLFAINKSQKIYANNPLSIGKGQNMTSPLMHAIALQEIYERLMILLKQKKGSEIKILDIGCGRGYIAFAISKIIEKCDDLKDIKVFVKGIDIYEDLTYGANEILHKLNINKNITFQFDTLNIEQEIQNKQQVYDIIHSGVALELSVYNNMIGQIYAQNQEGSCIICPVIQEDLEQNLYLRCNNQEHVVMKCVYSQMITLKQQEISKYFLEDGEIAEEDSTSTLQAQSQQSQEEMNLELLENTKLKREQHKVEQQLSQKEAQLKQYFENFKKNNNGIAPNLKEMNSNEETKQLLNEISHLKKQLKIVKAKQQIK
ncbi:L-isoaspartate O-methyltransferase (macronuclear) [Tetrahymena thermophila SB210]|uniref:protein-L-isoaspartate(D-aspartate) O-methyltransferase n=1 Tax=Tetrahymena thermophila (strain SB210) TaxID=312017 RepID=Q236L4_TETTS|nr:L-isoaspartate O-methyltransferase [Tetrahymena thermophila SB210]EAR92486.1 L-isoaspartate O-methyltransferase [Tetrahymena thermophila SB210]|eukprot:XP_001012731.1 L-isoaspartate O-methyltransferase [Tetrahymena thermophila SB210]